MAAVGFLSNILDNEEIQFIPTELITKIESHVSSREEKIDEIKAKYEKLRVNSEQEYFELEKQLITSNSKLEVESRSKSDAEKKVSDLERKYDESTEKAQSLEKEQEETGREKLRLKKQNELLETEKRDLALLIERKNKENDRLSDEVKEITEKCTRAIKEKTAAIGKTAEMQTAEISRQYREKRFEQEKKQLEQQITFLNAEIQEKAKELLSTRKEKSSKLLEIQSELENKTDELKTLQDSVDSLKDTNTKQSKKIENLIQKLKDARDEQSASEESSLQEIQAQARLIDLYKESSEAADKEVTKLTGACEELQNLLKKAVEARTEMEKKIDEDNEMYRNELSARDERVEKLSEELFNANDLLSQLKSKGIILSEEGLETLSPSAAAASKLLKSGMSLTQIYNEYVQATDRLQIEKEENQRLNQYLDEIMQDISEKAPLMKKQREDYEASLQTINHLTQQLDGAMLECENLRASGDEARRKLLHQTRELTKFQQESVDLGQQVRYLVKEIEEIRGGRVIKEADTTSSEVSSSSQLISGKLVTFRNIQELQSQNQKLLQAIRDLSNKKEEQENQAAESRTKELRQQLESVLDELEVLKSSRQKQSEMVESIVRQRDMFRVLAQQGGMSPILTSPKTPVSSTSVKIPKSPGVQISDKALEEANGALKELQAEYATYKKEKCENEKILNEQLEKLRKQCSDARVLNAQISSQLDYSSERFKVLQGNVEGYRKEISSLREKNQKYSTSIMKHEQTISALREDLLVSSENLAKAEVQIQNVRSEKDLIKSSEHRLMLELESVRKEKVSQTMVLSNLEAIKNNLERAEVDTKSRLTNQIESYEKQVKALQRKLDFSDNQQQSIIKHWESQTQAIKKNLDQEVQTHQKTKSNLKTSEKEIENLKTQIKIAEEKSASAEAKLSKIALVSSEQTTEELKDLKSQLAQSQTQVQKLREQNEKTKQHADQYKAISDGVEKSLREHIQTSKEMQQKLENKIVSSTSEHEALKKRITTLEKEKQDSLKANNESHKLNEDLRKQLASLKTDIEEAGKRREAAIDIEDKARNDCQEQAKIAKEAQDKYEREVMLHAEDLESVANYKKQIEGFNQQYASLQEIARSAEERLKESESCWSNQEKQLKDEIKKLENRLSDLRKQNSALHSQMQKITSRVVQEVGVAAAKLQLPESSNEEESSSEQLFAVIKFLRKEKEIADGKVDVVQADCSRLKQKVEHTEKLLHEATSALEEERGKSEMTLKAAAHHAELMRKVENLNLLTDSNKLLRQDIEKLNEQVKEGELKCQKMESDINPLKASIKDLQSNRDAILIEKATLQNELERWKTRTNQLIEQANRVDPEEKKKLLQEKEDIRKQYNTANEEVVKLRADLSRINSAMTNVQKEIAASQQEIKRLNEEIETKNNQISSFGGEMDEKNKTINQLKKIGRKYKEQAEELKTKNEEMSVLTAEKTEEAAKAKQAAEAAQAAQPAPLITEQELKELKEKLATTEKQCDSLKEQVTEKDQVKVAEVAAAKEEAHKVQETVEKHQLTINQLQDEKNQSRKVLQSARNKINAQKNQNDQLTAENAELKKKVSGLEESSTEQESRLNALKSLYEGQIVSLRQELTTAQQTIAINEEYPHTIEKLQKEITELQSKIQQLQMQLEQQKQAAQPVLVQRPSASASIERASSSGEVPKKAIRPITSSAPTVRPTAPIQSTSAKATASIRPMAISPSTTPPVITPTATVMPTVSQTDIQDEILIQPTPAAVVPIQVVQPQIEIITDIPPEPEQVEQVTISELHPAISESTVSTSSTLPPLSAATVLEPEPQAPFAFQSGKRLRDDLESESSTESQMKRSRVGQPEQLVLPSIIVTEDQSSAPSTSALHSESVEPSHPSNDQSDAPLRSPAFFIAPPMPISESMFTEQMPVVEESVLPQQVVESSFSMMDSAKEQAPQDLEDYVESPVVAAVQEEDSQDIVQRSIEIETTPVEDDDDDDCVIVVESKDKSDEEEEYEGEMDDEYEENEEDEDEDDEYQDEDDIEDEDGPTGEIEGDYEEENNMQTGADQAQTTEPNGEEDDDDVVIVDIGESDSHLQGQPTSQSAAIPPSQPQSFSQVQRLPPPLQPMSFRGERIPSSGARTQLTPFMIGGQPQAFDEGDDCTVPSTPTLVIPRRGDAFEQAVSSPQVQQSFTFGSGLEGVAPQPELAQLESQGALGMDDTRMDLSQFDDGGGTKAPQLVISNIVSVPPESTEGTAGAQSTGTESTLVGEESEQQELAHEGEDVDGEEHAEVIGEQEDDFERSESEEHVTSEMTEIQNVSESVIAEGGDLDEKMLSPGGTLHASTSHDTSTDASGMAKPKIQKIVWDTPAASQSSPAQSPARSRPTAVRSARGTFPRGRAASVRGVRVPGQPQRQPLRGVGVQRGRMVRGRSGPFRRPPMY